MPPKKERVTRADFNNLSERALIRSNLFDIAYKANPDFKVACVISKKRVKLAVDRNKVRRKAYNAFKETGFKRPYIIILYPRIEMLRSPQKDLVVELSKALATLT